MPFSLEEIGPDRFLPVSDEYTDDLYAQILGLSKVPSIPNASDVVAVFGIYSIDTCKTERTSFNVQVLHCSGDGSGIISDAERTLEFDPDVLQHYENTASSFVPASVVNNNVPSLFAVDIRQRDNAWLMVGPISPGHNHFRLALLGVYVQSLPV
jgi:hypothetical protein